MGVIDIERFHEVRRFGHNRLVEPVKTNLHGKRFDPGKIQNVLSRKKCQQLKLV